MFSEWLDLPAPQYQLSPLKSTFLVGNRPVNVCKKLDVSVCEDIRLQLRSVAYGVEMNEWWQDIKVCCGWVLQLKDNESLQKYSFNCKVFLQAFKHSQTRSHLQIGSKQNDSNFDWFQDIQIIQRIACSDAQRQCCKAWNFFHRCILSTCTGNTWNFSPYLSIYQRPRVGGCTHTHAAAARGKEKITQVLLLMEIICHESRWTWTKYFWEGW